MLKQAANIAGKGRSDGKMDNPGKIVSGQPKGTAFCGVAKLPPEKGWILTGLSRKIVRQSDQKSLVLRFL
ncbi:MAG: hypothetical protein JNL17_14025 [Cyclobacteriaceae bacterium]|nr:hypothetical protein [Cyclobacteriaceae bacterium]